MGPVLFTLSVSSLSQHLPSAHVSADDTLLYFSFRPMSLESLVLATCINVLESCISEVCSWFIFNYLMINDIKTEFHFSEDKIKPPKCLSYFHLFLFAACIYDCSCMHVYTMYFLFCYVTE